MLTSSFLSPHSLRSRFVRFFSGFDRPLLLIVGTLCIIGLVEMSSAGYDHGSRPYDHARNILIAATIAFVVGQIPYQRLVGLAPLAYAAGMLLLICVAWFGITKKGATRWLSIGITDIQPSEIMKIATPLILAWWFQLREERLTKFDFLVAFFLLSLPVALILRQPDLGTATLVLFSGLAIIYFAGLRWIWIVPPFLLGLVGIGLLIVLEPTLCNPDTNWYLLHEYQKNRVCTLLDPTSDPLGKGFHTLQGMIAIGSGGLWGKGYMSGTQTHLEFIPERTTDFIFSALAEEFGLAGALLLIACFVFLILRALFIALNGASFSARLLAGSMAAIFFTYSFVNLGMVNGLLPVVGVPLPFISYGGTAMVTLGLAIGILLSISRGRQLVQS